jgi:hypothetical protein
LERSACWAKEDIAVPKSIATNISFLIQLVFGIRNFRNTAQFAKYQGWLVEEVNSPGVGLSDFPLIFKFQLLRLKNTFVKGSPIQVGLYAALAAFLTYTMIFGFRKSFTVCTFDGITVGSLSYKTVLVLSQMLGYLAAKFYGIKFIAELKRFGRNKIILILVGIAWMAWLCFALIPAPYNIPFLFINGFPLGMLWGVVFSYVEGRRSTDFIGAALAVSFIFSSGFVKSIGGWLLQLGISEFWVPFCTGLVFALPLLFFIYLMERIPPPDTADEKARMSRIPMSSEQRKLFIRQFLPGLIACIFIYAFATLFRDIRDNFSADMWKEMGYLNQPAIFAKTETPITLIILVLIGSIYSLLQDLYWPVRAPGYLPMKWFHLCGG